MANKLNTNTLQLLSILLSVFLIAHPVVKAQSPSDTAIHKSYTLEKVIITAERTPILFEQAKRSIQVISKKEIELLPVKNLSELLGYALSADVRTRGMQGTQADISIRGGTFDQTLILLNGVYFNDPQTGHHNLDIPIDIASISRIEVLKGSGARLFGANAFNGVINIITNEAEKSGASISLMAGQYGTYALTADARIKSKNASQQLQISATGSDGFIKNTDHKIYNLFYSGAYGIKRQWTFQAGYLNKKFGANSFYTPKYPNQFEATKTIFGSLQYNSLFKNYSPVIFFRRHYDRFELFRDNAPSWYKSHNYHFTDVLGASGNFIFSKNDISRFSIGYELKYEWIRSNKLGDTLAHPIKVPREANIYYTLGKNRISASIFAEEAITLGKFSASAGLLTAFLSALPEKIAFYPGIDVSYQIDHALRWVASVNRTLRLPTFTDLYYNDATSKGDPNLKPETAISLETGLKLEKKGISAQANIFKRYGRNMIDWVKLQNQDPWQAKNITQVNISGVESYIKFNFKEMRQHTPLKTLSIGYTYLFANKTSNDFISRYVLDILKHKADVIVTHTVYKNLSASWALHVQDRVGGYVAFENGAFAKQETPYKPFSTLDIQLNYTAETFSLFAEATNLFDNQQIDIANVPQVGCWMRAGIKCFLVKRN